MPDVVVLDTNVLLADPTVLLSFPRSDVVIPETVLGELDKLKTARVDPDLRFRGREISRILFDLSEEGSLVDGVELPDGGTLRVAPFESDVELPSGLQTRNADDRILAAVFQTRAIYGPEASVTLVTNDLNMLLKAQTLGVPVHRHGDGIEGGFARRYLIRPFQRYRVPITILAVAVAVFAAVLVLAFYLQPSRNSASNSTITVPPELKNVLTGSQQAAFDAASALQTIQSHSQDAESLHALAAFYYDQYSALAPNDPAMALASAQQAIRYSERYLAVNPHDNDAKVDLAVLYFYTGQTDRAIQVVTEVLKVDRSHIKANYNLGIFLWQSPRRDFLGAAAQFERVIQLTQNDPRQTDILQAAKNSLTSLAKDAASSGRPLPSNLGSIVATSGVTGQ